MCVCVWFSIQCPSNLNDHHSSNTHPNSQEIFIRGLESGDNQPGFYRSWGLREVCGGHTQRDLDIAAHGNRNVRLRQVVKSLQVYVGRFTQLILELWVRQHIDEYFRKLDLPLLVFMQLFGSYVWQYQGVMVRKVGQDEGDEEEQQPIDVVTTTARTIFKNDVGHALHVHHPEWLPMINLDLIKNGYRRNNALEMLRLDYAHIGGMSGNRQLARLVHNSKRTGKEANMSGGNFCRPLRHGVVKAPGCRQAKRRELL